MFLIVAMERVKGFSGRLLNCRNTPAVCTHNGSRYFATERMIFRLVAAFVKHSRRRTRATVLVHPLFLTQVPVERRSSSTSLLASRRPWHSAKPSDHRW